jgi:hypothetical protein
MKFSEYFNFTSSESMDFFDSFLSLDTDLFIDPFLLYSMEENEFLGSHDEIIQYFESVFYQIAKSRGNVNSTYYKTGIKALNLPEVKELCLGYTRNGIEGLGSGSIIAKIMAAAIWDAINAGIKDIDHFEEIALLHEGIGADRISDAISNVIKSRLAKYTKRICEQYSVPLIRVPIRHGYYDTKYSSWRPINVDLPMNPFGSGPKPILLIPKKYLRKLPTINAGDFWDYCYTNENEILRKEFGDDISRNVKKEKIISFAKSHSDIRREYISKVEGTPGKPYDFITDDQGLYNWTKHSSEYVRDNQLTLDTSTQSAFFNCVDLMLNSYKHFIEAKGGLSLLWNDNKKPKRENAAQLLCLGIIDNHCKTNNIDLTREAYVGRGFVDFKVSRGYALRALIEVKKVNNSKFWNGLEIQLPTYMFSESIKVGYFIVIVLTDKDLQRIDRIRELAKTVSVKLKYDIKVISIDARVKPSASKL